jgi:DNA gyrase/topoisomerase IV subunit B
MNIDLSEYNLIQPSSIKKKKGSYRMYDIAVEDDNTFYVKLSNTNIILTHNCDGQHIASLLINFFHKWFPHIIKDNRLFKIITPLVACNYGKDRHYFYTSGEFNEFAKNKKITNLTYLKGLGSLSIEDWQYVMNNKILFQIYPDRSAKRYLDIAFGVSANKRKKWLESKIK